MEQETEIYTFNKGNFVYIVDIFEENDVMMGKIEKSNIKIKLQDGTKEYAKLKKLVSNRIIYLAHILIKNLILRYCDFNISLGKLIIVKTIATHKLTSITKLLRRVINNLF